MKNTLNNLIDKTLDIFFNKNKTKLYVLILFVIGFILRLINVLNFGTSVDASGHALMAFNFIDSGKLATWNQSVGLWYFLTDLAYKVFGVGDFSARFVALILGSFSIIIMFLFVKEVFNERVGLIAAFLLAFSPFHIIETVPEMDVATMFFVLFSMYFFIKALKQNKNKYFIFSGILLGCGILIKIYSVLFAPALLLFAIYYIKKKKCYNKKIKRGIILFLIVVFIFCLVPVLYNYLLYKNKGFVDYIFTNTLGIGKEKSDQYYSWIGPYEHDYSAFFIGNYKNSGELPFFVYYIKSILKFDVLIMSLGLIGLLFIFKRENKDYLILFLAMFIAVYIYMGSIPYLMHKHYMFLLIFFCPLSALTVNKLTNKIIKINPKIWIILIIIFQLYWISTFTDGNFYHKSSMNQLVDYKKDSIQQNSLVIYDARIFRGQGTYFFMDKHYLESSLFPQLINSQEQSQGNNIQIETYFIECVKDDCGWGTIKDQPDFNKSMEEIVDFFKNNSKIDKTIKNNKGEEEFKIYKTNLQLKQSVFQLADSTHIFWANPVGYDEKITPIFDNYKTHTVFEKSLDKLAHYILYLSVILAIMSIFVVLYLFFIEGEEEYKDE